jgi:putative lipoprotein
MVTEAPIESAAPVEAAVVSGTVTLPADAVVPEGATWSIRVEDTSLADAPATLIAEQSGVLDAAVTEIVFDVPFDPAVIDEMLTYTLRVTIEDAAGNLLFTNDTSIEAITGGVPAADIEVPVIAVTAVEPEASMAAASPSAEASAIP